MCPEELAASGRRLGRQPAGELIAGQVRAVATLLRGTEAAARTYLGDEIITDVARRMLFEVAGERPGAGLVEPPRTVPLPLALVGITVAALGRGNAGTGGQRTARSPWGRHHHLRPDAVRAWADHRRRRAKQAGNPAQIPFPPALPRRAARYISGAVDPAASGGRLPDRIPETAHSQLAATLRRDADGLSAITTTD